MKILIQMTTMMLTIWLLLLAGQCGRTLDFNQRLEVAIDVAHGLTYLHLYAGDKLSIQLTCYLDHSNSEDQSKKQSFHFFIWFWGSRNQFWNLRTVSGWNGCCSIPIFLALPPSSEQRSWILQNAFGIYPSQFRVK